MRNALVLSGTMAVLTVCLLVEPRAQQAGANANEVVVGTLAGKPVIQPVRRGVDYRDTISPTDAAVNGPVPRLPDGHPDLTGPWVGGGSNADLEAEGGLKPGELPLLPWAKQLRDSRKEGDEPYTACLPMSVPRVNPYPWKFAMTYTSKGLTQIYLLHETGDAGYHRVVHMDQTEHPEDLLPTWGGLSIGPSEWDKV